MTSILIGTPDKLFVKRLGARRNAAKKPGRTRRIANVFDDRQLDILGCLGELAAARALGVEMDTSVTVGGDRGFDLVVGDALVAVKFNHRRRGYLVVEERDGDDMAHLHDIEGADYIALVQGNCVVPDGCVCEDSFNSPDPFSVTVAGLIDVPSFLAKAKRKDWGLGLRRYVTASTLTPVSDWMWWAA